ncbi:putative Cytochrome P450 71D10 [Hibiscus syriacus]|uniref:Cytochrome P450 71D10 n=1 Tax=Hibiscus syriacus TaxID=106335 RepID=A0A6A3CE03_HIBSY|nr:putative Cytochrome P450 71D10 [Hibiscus syriacus]
MLSLSNNGASVAMELQFPSLLTLFSSFLFLAVVAKIAKKVKTLYSNTQRLPPGPWKLPLIGNLHQLAGSIPHRILRDLAGKHGPLMHLQLGETFNIVVSSREIAKEVLITHGTQNCTLELLTAKRIKSFESIRQEEVSNLVKYISSNEGLPVNFSKKIFGLTYDITSRAAFGSKYNDRDSYSSIVEEISDKILQFVIDDHRERLERGKIGDEGEEAREDLITVLLKIQQLGQLELPLSDNDIKAIIWDVFSGGSETSSTIVDWAMSEMMRNPRVLQKAQNEVRSVCNGKGDVDEANIEELKYLALVIKETLRLHPSFPLLVPRESREDCEINGYGIPAKTRVIINAWAIARDPKYWIEPETFYPERFLNSSSDYKGTNLEFIPFGAGRRMCPGILYALPNIELPLAKLLYHFDWKLPNGMGYENLDMTEAFGVAVRRKENLILIPAIHKPCV